MPLFLVVALGAVGAAALTRLIIIETRRVNETLDRQRRDEAQDEAQPVRLERDPVTGDYRPRA